MRGSWGMRWSPDGTRIAFIRAGSTAGDAIWVADGDGTNRREIVPASGGVCTCTGCRGLGMGSIYYIRRGDGRGSTFRRPRSIGLPANGGSPEPVVVALKRAIFPCQSRAGTDLISPRTRREPSSACGSSLPDGPAIRPLTYGLGGYAEAGILAVDGPRTASSPPYRHSSIS